MTHHLPDDHDRGLAFDLGTLLKRRHVLSLLGAASTLVACDGPPSNSEPNKTATAADGSTCIKDPAETSGPFPADGTNSKGGTTVNVLNQSGVVRQDIRTSFGAMTPVAAGTPFNITITVVNVAKACATLQGYAVYIWHCDVGGKYSLYDLPDSNYLRGVGITDTKGQVTFTTIFPGCYPGRWPHIHFEVFASAEQAATAKDSLLISQFALPADACAAVYADSAYGTSATNLTKSSFESDGIFADNTKEQNASMTLAVTGMASNGLSASVTVGVA